MFHIFLDNDLNASIFHSGTFYSFFYLFYIPTSNIINGHILTPVIIPQRTRPLILRPTP